MTGSWQFSIGELLGAVTLVACLAATSQIPAELYGGAGWIIHWYAALLALYVGKWFIARRCSARDACVVYLLLLLALLPYTYCCVSLFNEPFAFWPAEWIGDPVLIFAVPTASFLLFDIHNQWRAPAPYILRSLIELVVVFPTWTFLWGLLQLFVMNWAWI